MEVKCNRKSVGIWSVLIGPHTYLHYREFKYWLFFILDHVMVFYIWTFFRDVPNTSMYCSTSYLSQTEKSFVLFYFDVHAIDNKNSHLHICFCERDGKGLTG